MDIFLRALFHATTTGAILLAMSAFMVGSFELLYHKDLARALSFFILAGGASVAFLLYVHFGRLGPPGGKL